MPVSTVRVRGKNFPTETECKNNPLSPRHWGIKVLQLYSIRTSSCSKKWSPFIRNCVTRGVGTRCYRFVLQGTESLSRLVTFPYRRTPLRKETVNINRKKTILRPNICFNFMARFPSSSCSAYLQVFMHSQSTSSSSIQWRSIFPGVASKWLHHHRRASEIHYCLAWPDC